MPHQLKWSHQMLGPKWKWSTRKRRWKCRLIANSSFWVDLRLEVCHRLWDQYLCSQHERCGKMLGRRLSRSSRKWDHWVRLRRTNRSHWHVKWRQRHQHWIFGNLRTDDDKFFELLGASMVTWQWLVNHSAHTPRVSNRTWEQHQNNRCSDTYVCTHNGW